MSDRFPGEITVGGTISKKLCEEFCWELNLAGGEVGGFGSPTRKQFFRNWRDVTDNLGDDGLLRLSNDEAAYGMFEELEEFLVKHGIAFDRRSEAGYGYDAENVSFRPGMKKPVVCFADQGGNPMVPIGDLKPLVGSLRRLVKVPPATVKEWRKAIEVVCKRLDRVLPPDVPPLTKLEIK
jgi:hypothetical protein